MNTVFPQMRRNARPCDRMLTATELNSLIRTQQARSNLIAMRRSTRESLKEALLSPIEAQTVIDDLTRRLQIIERKLRRFQ